jgi:hypothetical protein
MAILPAKKKASSPIYKGSHVSYFLAAGRVYEHVIYPSEDDRIECLDDDMQVVLTYTRNGQVLDKHKRQIGRFIMREYDWIYQDLHETRQWRFGSDLLKAEVGVSQMYINGELL